MAPGYVTGKVIKITQPKLRAVKKQKKPFSRGIKMKEGEKREATSGKPFIKTFLKCGVLEESTIDFQEKTELGTG